MSKKAGQDIKDVLKASRTGIPRSRTMLKRSHWVKAAGVGAILAVVVSIALKFELEWSELSILAVLAAAAMVVALKKYE